MIYEVENVNFKYESDKRLILDDVSLSLNEGEVMSILGPNGAGKTTLLNCLAALSTPNDGVIKLCGRDISDMKVKEIASLVSYVPQNHIPAFSYTVMHFVLMGRAPKIGMFERPKDTDIEITMKILEEMGLSDLADKPYTELSGGERQKVTIARALVQEPKAILFDEPTAHLDYGNQIKILRLIKHLSEKGYAVIITTHNPDHAIMLGGTVSVLSRDGKLQSGPVSEIITESKLKEVYDAELRLVMMEEFGRNICVPPNL